MAKSEDCFLVRASRDVSLDGEVWGLQQHLSEGGVKTYGIAGADGQAEAARKEDETAREAAEAKRAEDEAARVQAETARAAAEKERAAQQVKNNADQAANNAAAQGLIAVIVEDYDPVTLKPNGSGQNGKMYLVPIPEANAMAEAIPVSFALTPTDGGEYIARQVDARAAAAGDVYVEWLWINNQFERIGLSTATLDPITTDHIDAVVSGESPQGKQVLTLTGLTYLWTKLKTVFAAFTHKHVTGDVTGLDTALGDKATKAELKTVQDSLGLTKLTYSTPPQDNFDVFVSGAFRSGKVVTLCFEFTCKKATGAFTPANVLGGLPTSSAAGYATVPVEEGGISRVYLPSGSGGLGIASTSLGRSYVALTYVCE